jgi:zinc protease
VIRWPRRALVLALLIIPPGFSPTVVSAAVLPIRRLLPTGLRLIVVEQPGAALTAIEVRARVGSATEAPETNGLAHLTEHMVFKCAIGGPGSADAAMEALGGELTARTSRDSTRFAAVTPSANWRKSLDVLSALLLRPAFRPDDLAAEKAVIRSEMAVVGSEPERAGFADLAAVAFAAGDADRLPLMGSREFLDRFTADDLRAFHRRWYRPENLTVVVVGDVRAGDVADAVTSLFPAPASAATAPLTVTVAQPIVGIVRAPLRAPGAQLNRSLVTVFFGFAGPQALDTARLPAIEALLGVLAPDRARGRLGEALIDRDKIALSVSAAYLPGRTNGLIILSATGARGAQRALEAAILGEVRRLRDEPITDAETESARAETASDILYDDGSAAGLATRLADQDARGLPATLSDDYAGQVAAVSADAVRQAATQFLTPTRYAVAVIGPSAPRKREIP